MPTSSCFIFLLCKKNYNWVSTLALSLVANASFRVRIHDVATGRQLTEVDKPRTAFVEFSPCNTIMATWEPYMGIVYLHSWTRCSYWLFNIWKPAPVDPAVTSVKNIYAHTWLTSNTNVSKNGNLYSYTQVLLVYRWINVTLEPPSPWYYTFMYYFLLEGTSTGNFKPRHDGSPTWTSDPGYWWTCLLDKNFLSSL